MRGVIAGARSLFFLSDYSGVVGDIALCLRTTTILSLVDFLRINSGTVVSHYGRKESSASACMPPAATAATAAAFSLRRKLVNSLLTNLL